MQFIIILLSVFFCHRLRDYHDQITARIALNTSPSDIRRYPTRVADIAGFGWDSCCVVVGFDVGISTGLRRPTRSQPSIDRDRTD